MLLTYEVDGHPMGSELNLMTSPQLARRRHFRVAFRGTAHLNRIDVIRNNQVVYSHRGQGLDADFCWEDTEALVEALMPPARFCAKPFCFYYMRAVQVDGEVAWASPIWVDAEP
jgi:hypothetical protein